MGHHDSPAVVCRLCTSRCRKGSCRKYSSHKKYILEVRPTVCMCNSPQWRQNKTLAEHNLANHLDGAPHCFAPPSTGPRLRNQLGITLS
eukprot:1800248-Amphidinium_carterae.1